MRALLRGRSAVLWLSAGALFCLWVAFSAATADTHFVCTQGAPATRDAPGGECVDGYTALGGAAWNVKLGEAGLMGIWAAALGWAAWQNWRRTP